MPASTGAALVPINSVDAAYDYAEDVLAGKIIVGRYAQLGIARFVNDLERADRNEPDFPYIFSPERAQLVLDFYGNCRLIKGHRAGSFIELSPWQIFWIANVFGWIDRETMYRRFRMAALWVPRKNGKTTMLAPIALYMLGFDGEGGSEVYCGATTEKQARILFNIAKHMVKKSGDMARHLEVYADSVEQVTTASKLEPVHANSDTLDGLDSHCNIVDELHAHKDRHVFDTLATGMAARKQPLQASISTAGYDVTGVGFEEWDYLVQVLEGTLEDDQLFGMIYSADKGDDYYSEKTFAKANPNYRVSVEPNDMRALARKAQQLPNHQPAFLTKRLNIWTNAVERWIDMDAWKESGQPFMIEDFRGFECYMGIDLSDKEDLTSIVLLFPPQPDLDDWLVYPIFYIPEDNIMKRVKDHRVPYDVWVKQGFIRTTPGKSIDYDEIGNAAIELVDKFDVLENGYDPYNATIVVKKLDAYGVDCVEVRQGVQTLSEPTKELGRLYTSGLLSHNQHPVLAWNARNAVLRRDHNNNIMISKKLSREKIDGLAALINALSRALANATGDDDEDYEPGMAMG